MLKEISVGGIIELEKHHFVTSNKRIDSVNDHQWLIHLEEKLMGTSASNKPPPAQWLTKAISYAVPQSESTRLTG